MIPTGRKRTASPIGRPTANDSALSGSRAEEPPTPLCPLTDPELIYGHCQACLRAFCPSKTACIRQSPMINGIGTPTSRSKLTNRPYRWDFRMYSFKSSGAFHSMRARSYDDEHRPPLRHLPSAPTPPTSRIGRLPRAFCFWPLPLSAGRVTLTCRARRSRAWSGMAWITPWATPWS